MSEEKNTPQPDKKIPVTNPLPKSYYDTLLYHIPRKQPEITGWTMEPSWYYVGDKMYFSGVNILYTPRNFGSAPVDSRRIADFIYSQQLVPEEVMGIVDTFDVNNGALSPWAYPLLVNDRFGLYTKVMAHQERIRRKKRSFDTVQNKIQQEAAYTLVCTDEGISNLPSYLQQNYDYVKPENPNPQHNPTDMLEMQMRVFGNIGFCMYEGEYMTAFIYIGDYIGRDGVLNPIVLGKIEYPLLSSPLNNFCLQPFHQFFNQVRLNVGDFTGTKVQLDCYTLKKSNL